MFDVLLLFTNAAEDINGFEVKVVTPFMEFVFDKDPIVTEPEV